ncbi:hypothetical protein ACEQPO_03600 [Bacillus sp. SL00103]
MNRLFFCFFCQLFADFSFDGWLDETFICIVNCRFDKRSCRCLFAFYDLFVEIETNIFSRRLDESFFKMPSFSLRDSPLVHGEGTIFLIGS